MQRHAVILTPKSSEIGKCSKPQKSCTFGRRMEEWGVEGNTEK